METFTWLHPGRLVDGDLELILVDRIPADLRRGWVPVYRFDMRLVGSEQKMGYIDLRIGDTPNLLLYGGHIGYGVDAGYRGRHYAARACRLLFPFARSHEMQTLWITCNPDNWSSRRTCELAGAVFVEIVDLPPYVDMFNEGERQKCRYRIDLDTIT